MAKACFHFMRVILVIISLIFMLLGLAVVALSIFLKLAPPMMELAKDGVGTPISIALYVLMGLGFFMAIFGFIGCFGACRKSTACLGIYITILLIIIIAEIAVGIFLVIKTQLLVEKVDAQMDKFVKDYKEKKSSLIDVIQKIGQCCGSDSYNDYDGVTLPSSCCQSTPVLGTCLKANVLNVPGCKKRLKTQVFQKGFPVLIGTILGIAGIEFIGIAFAIAICCHSRRQDAGYVSVVT